MKKVVIVVISVLMALVAMAMVVVVGIAIVFGISKNNSQKSTIENVLEKRYNKDFEIASIERESRELKGTFFQKFRYVAVVKDKKTNKTFLARKNEDDDIVEDKYYEILVGDNIKNKLNTIIAKNSKFKFVDKNKNGFFNNKYSDKGCANEQECYRNNLICIEATIETNEASNEKLKEDVYNLAKDLENEGFCYILYVSIPSKKKAYIINYSVGDKKITREDVTRRFASTFNYWDDAYKANI